MTDTAENPTTNPKFSMHNDRGKNVGTWLRQRRTTENGVTIAPKQLIPFSIKTWAKIPLSIKSRNNSLYTLWIYFIAADG